MRIALRMMVTQTNSPGGLSVGSLREMPLEMSKQEVLHWRGHYCQMPREDPPKYMTGLMIGECLAAQEPMNHEVSSHADGSCYSSRSLRRGSLFPSPPPSQACIGRSSSSYSYSRSNKACPNRRGLLLHQARHCPSTTLAGQSASSGHPCSRPRLLLWNLQETRR